MGGPGPEGELGHLRMGTGCVVRARGTCVVGVLFFPLRRPFSRRSKGVRLYGLFSLAAAVRASCVVLLLSLLPRVLCSSSVHFYEP